MRLGIFYGYPSLVNGAGGSMTRAVAAFSAYDILVFGDGLEFDAPRAGCAGAAEHRFAKDLIGRLAPRRISVFGYVDLGRTQGLSAAQLHDRIGRWAEMGARGVLFDEAGFDFGVTRARQNAAVRAAHARGLGACLNAFRPDDVFSTRPTPLNAAGGGNPDGLAPAVSAGDAVLVEPFAIADGARLPLAPQAARVGAALAGRRAYRTSVFGIATAGSRGADRRLMRRGWWTAVKLGLDAYGWGTPVYGAADSLLAWPDGSAPEQASGPPSFRPAAEEREQSWPNGGTD